MVFLFYSEGCLACITAYLVYLCTETHYEKVSSKYTNIVIEKDFKNCHYHGFQCIRKVSKYIASQNERVYHPKGLQITDPTFRGFRVIEISLLDRPVRT